MIQSEADFEHTCRRLSSSHMVVVAQLVMRLARLGLNAGA